MTKVRELSVKFGQMNKIIQTADGSNTLYNETIGEHYHSKHGAVQESKHVFIDAGLKHIIEKTGNQPVTLLEIGFGTGLNFLFSLEHCLNSGTPLSYTGIEAFPISLEALKSTLYDQYVPAQVWESLTAHYENALGKSVNLFPEQKLEIALSTLADFQSDTSFDLIYYDAFSVQHQPEMWTDEILAHTCSFLKPGGVFVTYAITGNLKRALKKAGLTIEKLPGAPGKREMLRATKV
jgi:tRNA U34 5-methylaminomethyl-2-thiouridine-forming methyltransferase MnmC